MNNKDKTRNGKPGPKPGKKKGVNARPGVNTQAKKIAIKAPTAQMAVVQIRQREQVKAQAKKRNLPRDSINFFTSAIDPMHDTRITFCGWPDKNIEQSVIRQIPQSFELAMPVANPNFAAATVWDCHINLQPWMNQVLFHERERVNNNIFVTSGNTCDIGGLQAYATLPGGDFTYGAENTLATGTVPLIGSLGIKESVSVGVGRLCGIGVEVINSTAPLYQSGLVYCWRLLSLLVIHKPGIRVPPQAQLPILCIFRMLLQGRCLGTHPETLLRHNCIQGSNPGMQRRVLIWSEHLTTLITNLRW